MKFTRFMLIAGIGLGLSACATADLPTRNAPFEEIPATSVTTPQGYRSALPSEETVEELRDTTVLKAVIEAPSTEAAIASLPNAPRDLAPYDSPVTVEDVIVHVPRSLKVSERNSYYPRGDIVWRGDPLGDRHAQVQAIFESALKRGVQSLHGPVKVDLEVTVKRFHALTEKARYTVGGVHSITFDLAVRDAETGKILVPPRTIRADLEGFGGQQAILAEARGETQKVRITNHLAEVIRQELSNPEGYRNASLGFFQLLNNL